MLILDQSDRPAAEGSSGVTEVADRASTYNSPVNVVVALRADGDEIFLVVITLLTPKLNVVNFKFCSRATSLTAPAVTAQHLLSKALVHFCIQAKPGRLRSQATHRCLVSEFE